LPIELLVLIINKLSWNSLHTWSFIDKRRRNAALPRLFHTAKFTFSNHGFQSLNTLATSELAWHVRTLHYEASELFDPLIQKWDYFAACVYTPQEYVRDQRELHPRDILSYSGIQSYLSLISQEQCALLENRDDTGKFSDAISRFPRLKSLKASFTGLQDHSMLWFSNRMFVGWDKSFPLYLETVFKAIIKMQSAGLLLKTIEINGFYAKLSSADDSLLNMASTALASVSKIHLADSSSLLQFLSHIHLPSLEYVSLAKCSLISSDLRRFLVNSGGVRSLHL
ncbi:hypothetical protein BO71DRAFT_314007, partial [Aspergillus ellipticus CBS 707.79]